MGLTIGVDLGGTKVLAALVDDGEVVSSEKIPTPSSGGVDAVVATITKAVEALDCSLDDVGGVGVGAPGVVDPTSGTVLAAPNVPGFDRPVPLAALLAEALGVERVAIDNDVNAAALGEHRHGAGRGTDDLLVVFVGTGVGGGLVLGGKVRRGPSGLAGEIGHMVVAHRDGRRCGCGRPGHLEAYAGRAAMEVEARRRHAAGEPTWLVERVGEGRMKSGTWRGAIEAGDAVAIELVDDAVVALGAALASVVHAVDLELVVVGGGLADKLGPPFVGRIEQEVRSRLLVPSSPLRVVPAELGDSSGVVGAALLPGVASAAAG
ncbi:MAG TPA: ROK family protein [Acidimicrobiales bacterium]|nr:ROK family protein [Acidimicrobiales bacterium]